MKSSLLLLSAFAVLLFFPSGLPGSRERTLFLVGLPAIGTVDWRCNGVNDQFALTFHAFRTSATDEILFRAGKVTRHATVQSGQTLRLPYASAITQRLDFLQGTEVGNLRATVKATFVRGRPYSYCWSYAPPQLDVHVTPR